MLGLNQGTLSLGREKGSRSHCRTTTQGVEKGVGLRLRSPGKFHDWTRRSFDTKQIREGVRMKGGMN